MLIDRIEQAGLQRGWSAAKTRNACGLAASLVGIGCNVLLFAAKLATGLLSGSVAIVADAVNNLSDVSTSVVSLIGFKLSGKPADAEHPYGHGRYEYLSALLVAAMIFAIGLETLKSGVERIFSPTPVRFSIVSIGVMAGSIAVKIWLSSFNRRVGKRIDSGALTATAEDSRNDVLATSAVLLSMLIARATGWALDGLMGVFVAVFILWSGWGLIRETVNPLLGSVPSEEKIAQIHEKILSYPGVLGAHDLMVHDYGPGRQFASVHVEMSAHEDPLASHEVIDRIERDFLNEWNLHLVVHYDPVATDDPRLPPLRACIEREAEAIDPRMHIHDLRIASSADQLRVAFDCVAPYDLKLDSGEIARMLSGAVRSAYPNTVCTINVEHGQGEDGM